VDRSGNGGNGVGLGQDITALAQSKDDLANLDKCAGCLSTRLYVVLIFDYACLALRLRAVC
jgi:hypothetical protein